MGKVDITNKYITIQGWMRTELGLKDNELILYAFIFGFCQDGVGKYEGNLAYIEEWLGITNRNVRHRLTSLVEKGYLDKKEKFVNGIKYCSYQAIIPENIKKISAVVTTTVGSKQPQGAVETYSGGRVETTPNNKNIYNKNNNKSLPPIVPQTDFEIIDCVVEKDYEFADVEVVDDLDFENVWKMYGEHGNKYLSQCEYNMIPFEEKQLVVQHIPEYIKANKEIRFRKRLENYLKTKEYNVKPINRNNNGPRTTKHSSLTDEDIFDIVSRAYSDDL